MTFQRLRRQAMVKERLELRSLEAYSNPPSIITSYFNCNIMRIHYYKDSEVL